MFIHGIDRRKEIKFKAKFKKIPNKLMKLFGGCNRFLRQTESC